MITLPAVVGAQLGLADHFAYDFGESGQPRLGEAVAVGDFDGDGLADFAIASPSADVVGLQNSGKVHVRKVAADGSFAGGPVSSCLDSTDRGDHFRLGAAVAFGDFDGDGDDDLAIGMPGATADGVVDVGAVCVLSGHEGSIVSAARQRFSQADLGSALEPGDLFGASLATGDLNGDGFEDLAIGSPGEYIDLGAGNVVEAGAVHVLFGGPGGLSTADAKTIFRRSRGNGWFPEPGERFGSSLAIGDFAGANGVKDLAVGAPGEHPNAVGGNVTLHTGSDDPTTLNGHTIPFSAGNGFFDLLGTPVPGDAFGSALAGGDFNGDGLQDLAVSIPGDSDFALEQQAGAVMVLFHDGVSLNDVGEQIFAEALIGGTVNAFDRFGTAIAAGDFDRDGKDDLAIGSPLDNSLGVINSGEVTVLYGGDAGLQLEGLQIINMIFFASLDPDDNFGSALATGRFMEPNGGDDLLIGVPGRVRESVMVGGENNGTAVVVQSTILSADRFESGDAMAWTSSN